MTNNWAIDLDLNFVPCGNVALEAIPAGEIFEGSLSAGFDGGRPSQVTIFLRLYGYYLVQMTSMHMVDARKCPIVYAYKKVGSLQATAITP